MDNVEACVAKFQEAKENGDAEAAFTALEGALAIDPKFVPALGCMGSLLGQLRRSENALMCFDRIVVIDPERGDLEPSWEGFSRRIKAALRKASPSRDYLLLMKKTKGKKRSLKVKSNVTAGLRAGDHFGGSNFMVEISGVNA